MSDHATTTASFTLESLYGAHHGWLKSWLTRKLSPPLMQMTLPRHFSTGNGQRAALDDPRSAFLLCTLAKRVMVDLFRRNALEKAYLEMLALMPENLAPSPEERESARNPATHRQHA